MLEWWWKSTGRSDRIKEVCNGLHREGYVYTVVWMQCNIVVVQPMKVTGHLVCQTPLTCSVGKSLFIYSVGSKSLLSRGSALGQTFARGGRVKK